MANLESGNPMSSEAMRAAGVPHSSEIGPLDPIQGSAESQQAPNVTEGFQAAIVSLNPDQLNAAFTSARRNN